MYQAIGEMMQEKTFKEIFDELCKTWIIVDKGYKCIYRINHPSKSLAIDVKTAELQNIKKNRVIYTFNTSKKCKYKVLPNNIIIEPEGVIAINLS